MCIGLENTVKLVPYNPKWEQCFQQEKKIIRDALLNQIISIEHIGSTSIPNTIAKPIIDILITVKTFNDGFNCIKPLEAIGYISRGELGISGRHYFRKGHPKRTHHIHMFEDGHPAAINHILFRDFLNNNIEYASKYTQLKKNIINKHGLNRRVYTESKSDFINEMLKRAKQELI